LAIEAGLAARVDRRVRNNVPYDAIVILG